jgi:hypothetical protein
MTNKDGWQFELYILHGDPSETRPFSQLCKVSVVEKQFKGSSSKSHVDHLFVFQMIIIHKLLLGFITIPSNFQL